MSTSPLVSPVADVRDSFGAAFVGLLVSTTSVLPWVFFYRVLSDLLNLQAPRCDDCADVSSSGPVFCPRAD
jgi:hypothetical protein